MPDYPGPRRRAGDNHVHPEYWTESDHNRFEDRVAKELQAVRTEVHNLGEKMTAQASKLSWLLGGIAVSVFIINIAVTVYLQIANS